MKADIDNLGIYWKVVNPALNISFKTELAPIKAVEKIAKISPISYYRGVKSLETES